MIELMKHFILFTGHMIDAKDRPQPRFPADKEEQVRQKIYERVSHQKKIAKGELEGIASGACGGDILFHEVCEALEIPTEVYLALPPEEFKKKSVSFAGRNWEERFDKLTCNKTIHVLPSDRNAEPGPNVYELTNEWMLDAALSSGGHNMSLIALWDGGGGDGKGGTEHMVNMAKEQGAEVEVIDMNKV